MDFVIEASYWILLIAVLIFAVVGFKGWYKKLAAALVVTAVGLYIGISWYRQHAVERTTTERLESSQALERAAGKIRIRIEVLTREALDFEFGRAQGPRPDRSGEVNEMRAKLDSLHQEAVRVGAFGPRLTVETLGRQLESLKSLGAGSSGRY
jgi:hypothetical protein